MENQTIKPQGGTMDFLEYLKIPKQEYNETLIPDDVATFEDIETENSVLSTDDQNNDFHYTSDENQQEKQKENTGNEGKGTHSNDEAKKPEDTVLEAEMVTLTIDFSINSICSLISKEETPETREQDLKNLERLWERYFSQSGKTVPLWLLMTISHLAVYGPAIGEAIYTRMKKEDEKRKIRLENARIEALKKEREKAKKDAEKGEKKENKAEIEVKTEEFVKVETGLLVPFIPDEDLKGISKNEYNGRLCKTCGNGLKGPNQKKFCSTKCASHYNVAK